MTAGDKFLLTSHSFLKKGHLMKPGGGIIHAQQISCVDRHSVHCSRGVGMQQLVNQGLSEPWGQGSAGFDHLHPREQLLEWMQGGSRAHVPAQLPEESAQLPEYSL